MVRTRHLLIVILLCVAIIFGAGVFSVASDGGRQGASVTNAIFATPQDSYEVEKYGDNKKDAVRREFINKVRDSIAQDPLVSTPTPPSPIGVTDEGLVSTSTPIVIIPPQTPDVVVPIPPVVVTPTPIPTSSATSVDTTDSEIQIEAVPIETASEF